MLSREQNRSAFYWIMTSMCRNRLFEWVTAGIMIWLSIRLVGNPLRLEHSTFRFITTLISPYAFLLILFGIGGFRVFILAIDGYHWQTWTPLLRSFGALSAAVIWGMMGLSLELLEMSGNGITIGSPLYFCLMLGEIFSCYRPLARHGEWNARI